MPLRNIVPSATEPALLFARLGAAAVYACGVLLSAGMAQSRSAVVQRPEIVLQSGHTGRIVELVITQDGDLAATADGSDGDGTIKLWQISTDRQLRTLVGHGGGIDVLAFSPDRRLLASGHEDDTIRIWEIATGRELHRFYVPDQSVDRLVFSPDSRFLASFPSQPGIGRDREPDQEISKCPAVVNKPGFCESHDISIWDTKTGQFRYAIQPIRAKRLDADRAKIKRDRYDVAFAPDSQVLAAGVDGNPITLMEVATGRLLPPPPRAVAPFTFDRASKRMASRLEDGLVAIWEVSSRRRIATLPSQSTPEFFLADGRQLITTEDVAGVETLHFWDLATLAELKRVTLGQKYQCANCYLYLAPNGRWVARGGFGEPKLALWDLAHPDVQPRLWYGLSAPLVFSSDDKYLFATYRNRIWEFDTATDAEQCSSVSPIGKTDALALSSTAAWLATDSSGDIALWALDTGVRSKLLSGHSEEVTSLMFVPDPTRLISGASPSPYAVSWLPGIGDSSRVGGLPTWNKPRCTINSRPPVGQQLDSARGGIWDVLGARLLEEMGDFRAPLAVSPDGRLAASGADEHAWIRLWSTSDGEHIRALDDSVPGRGGSSADRESALAFSADGNLLGSASTVTDDIHLWDMKTFQRTALRGHTDRPIALAYDPATGLLASTGWDKAVRLWNTTTHKQVGGWELNGPPTALAYIPDGKKLAIAVGDDVIEYDGSGREVHRFTGHANTVRALAYTPRDGAFLLTAGDDGTTRLWDAHSGEHLATLVSLANGDDWLVTTPSGLFDGPPSAWDQVLWRFGGNTFDVAPVEIFFRDFFRPGLLTEIMQGKQPSKVNITNMDRRQPVVSIVPIDSPSSSSKDISSREIKLRLAVAEAAASSHYNNGSGVRDVRLFRNGSLVKAWPGDVILDTNGTGTLEATARLIAGENLFTAYAFSRSNIKSRDSSLTVTGASNLKRDGTAYILAIGLNNYLNIKPGLNYAVADAADFAEGLRTAQAKLEKYADLEVVRLEDDHATKSNILSGLRRLAGVETGELNPGQPADLAKLNPAQPEDAVFIYYAGHGDTGHSRQRFYLLAHDYVQAKGDREEEQLPGAISDLELSDAIEGIDAGLLVLVIDACHSGQSFASEDPRQGPMNSKGLAQLAYDKGMYILAASQSDQAAKELSKLGHGLLTYALVEEGLKHGQADFAPKDGSILLREWLDFPAEVLPSMQQEGMMRAALPGNRGFSIVGGEENKKVSERTLQRPRVFYRREPDREPFIIAKP